MDFKHSAAAAILRRLREDGGALSAEAIPDVETVKLALEISHAQLGQYATPQLTCAQPDQTSRSGDCFDTIFVSCVQAGWII